MTDREKILAEKAKLLKRIEALRNQIAGLDLALKMIREFERENDGT